MSYSALSPQGCAFDVSDMLAPMSDVEGFLDEDGLIRPMLEDVAGTLPCFSAMREVCGEQHEDAVGSIRHGSFFFPLGAEPGNNEGVLITRLRDAGIPLRADEFLPFAYMAGDDKSLLPSVTLLLEASDTWLLVEDGGTGIGRSCLVYAWKGGKSYYVKNPADTVKLKGMVDKDAFRAKAISAPPRLEETKPVLSKVEQAIASAKAASRAAMPASASNENPLQRLKKAGFSPIGTQDMGPALEILAQDGTRFVVCRGDGPSLVRSKTYLLRTYNGGELQTEQSDMDADTILATLAHVPELAFPSPSP